MIPIPNHMFVSLSFRPKWPISPWLQGLCRESRKQWKQDRVGKCFWVLWSSKKRLGCQEPPRLCFCRVWRSQRCIRCCERTGWKVTPSTPFLVIVLFFNACFCTFHSWDDFFFLETCVAVECASSCPMGKSAQGAVAILHPGVVDALAMILGDVVLQSDAGMYFRTWWFILLLNLQSYLHFLKSTNDRLMYIPYTVSVTRFIYSHQTISSFGKAI